MQNVDKRNLKKNWNLLVLSKLFIHLHKEGMGVVAVGAFITLKILQKIRPFTTEMEPDKTGR
jgi:hypothetical protein